ncbi:L-histidine N(alpha)-methyltransferase [Chloroflexota bacterium]
MKARNSITAHDFRPGRERFLAEILDGLQKLQKKLPSKYLYDERGAALFERICSLEEYYIPRTEASIMEANIAAIVELIGPGVLLIEYGCGDCKKVRFLLDHLPDPVAFVPIDISQEQLERVAQELASDYPTLEVLPVCADYTSRLEIPRPKRGFSRKVVYFPGSTIGNFDPIPTRHFLEHIARVLGPGGAILIGVDLKKDAARLHRAYNDSQGVTAAFNLNLLKRINRELNCDFQLDCFRHYALYNPMESRIEMHLVSQKEQTVRLGNTAVHFGQGESIWTESSYKYSPDEFQQMAAQAGLRVAQVWTDPRQWFSVQYLVTADELTQTR